MVSFSINETDLTEFVDIQNYDVNLVEEYNAWFDGNGNEHRNVYAKKAAGTLQLGFRNDEEIAEFHDLLNAAKHIDGYYPVKTSINNAPGVRSYNAFITIAGAGKYDELNGREWVVYTLEVKER